jgi:serine-type D-Ala-D-Ala carboxypeptidase (penicillin-binding protein 5/6)
VDSLRLSHPRVRFEGRRGRSLRSTRMKTVRRCLLVTALAAATALSVGAAPALASGPNFSYVTGAALTDPTTGQELFGYNPNSERAIASTTKMMTALITLQHVSDLNTIFSQYNWRPAASDSQIGLAPKQKMSVYNLLIALLVPSADDAAMDLAYNVGHHSVARFVAMMNAEAVKLHLVRTHYFNPTGLDQRAVSNYSSAYDLTLLASYDMAHYPVFRHIVDLRSAVLSNGEEVQTTDGLLGEVPWINGVKTGHTDDAGYVLVSSGTQHGMRLIGSVLGTTSEAQRDYNGLTLMQWGFANFTHIHPVVGYSVVARPTVNGSSSAHTEITYAAGYQRDVAKRDRVSVDLVYSSSIDGPLPRNIDGPLPRNTIVGFANVIINGKRVAHIPLLLAHQIGAESPVVQAARFIGRPSTLIVLLLLVAIGAYLVMTRRRRARPQSRSRQPRTAL